MSMIENLGTETPDTEIPPDSVQYDFADRWLNVEKPDSNSNQAYSQKPAGVSKVENDLCTICQSVPKQSPLYGCDKGHYLCSWCRDKGGVLLSCPTCYNPEINCRLTALENRLFTQDCNFGSKGCEQKITEEARETHENDCRFRIVQCPKRLFAKTCNFNDSLIFIRDHGRFVHDYHKGFTSLDTGFITSKMMDDKDKSCMDSDESARFPPLEIEYDENLFYFYYERKRSRALWFFFIRAYGSEEGASQYTCEISLGSGDLQKNDVTLAGSVYRGGLVPYSLDRNGIQNSGLCLVVDDATVRKFRRGNVIFRVWCRVWKETE
jgi:hypothetical protein